MHDKNLRVIALQVLNGIRPFLSVSGGSIEIFELGADDPKVVLKMIGPPLKSMAATWQETLDGAKILETWKAYEIWLEVWNSICLICFVFVVFGRFRRNEMLALR